MSDLSETHQFTELDEASLLLLRAAELIERRGLCKGFRMDESGRLCIAGALHMAVGQDPRTSRSSFANSVYIELEQVLGRPAANWNDDPSRTADEVIATLRAVALGIKP
jgi:hypothetical protein